MGEMNVIHILYIPTFFHGVQHLVDYVVCCKSTTVTDLMQLRQSFIFYTHNFSVKLKNCHAFSCITWPVSLHSMLISIIFRSSANKVYQYIIIFLVSFQCFDAVGWATGMASGL